MPGELAFIERLQRLLPPAPEGQVWIGDDAAVLAEGELLKTDVLVEGVHFQLDWCTPADVGWKALAVNLSDIAAMAGAPTAALVSLVVPGGRPGTADAVMAGVVDAARRFGCPVVGGDTSSGPALVVSVAVLGRVGAHGPVLRSGARPGDVLAVTGELGGAADALAALGAGVQDPPGAERLRRPIPRLAAGAAAAAAGATAMIDLSDGLVVDLGHLCEASGCSAVVDELAVPRPPGVDIDTALRGGDDYELAFTIPAELAGALTPWRDPPATPIGVITEPGSPIRVRSAGRERALPGPAWEHDIPGPPEDDVPGSGPEDPPRRR